MDTRWLSNAFVVGDEPGGVAVFVDSGAPLEPLLDVVELERLTPTHILRTHGHPDHVEHEEELAARFGIPVVTGAVETGGLRVEAIATPGHSDDGVAFVINGELCTSPVRSVLRALARVTVGPAPGTASPIAPLPAYCSSGNGSTTRTAADAGAATASAVRTVASTRSTG